MFRDLFGFGSKPDNSARLEYYTVTVEGRSSPLLKKWRSIRSLPVNPPATGITRTPAARLIPAGMGIEKK